MLQEQISETALIHGDAPLSLTGERQITFKLTSKASDFNTLKTDLVYSSPLKRAVRSAAAAFPAKKIKLDPRLRELDASGGLAKQELQSYVETTCPGGNFDFGRVPDKPWCSPECVLGAPCQEHDETGHKHGDSHVSQVVLDCFFVLIFRMYFCR